MKTKTLGYFFALLCVLLWSFIPVVSRFGQQDLDNFQFLFWSNILSLVIVLLPTVLSGKLQALKSIPFKKKLYLILLGTLGCALYYLCLYYGYSKINGLEVLALSYSWPLFMVVLSALLLKEKVSIRSISSLVLGTVGILIVLTKGNLSKLQFSNGTVDLIVLFGGFIFALFSVLSKKVKEEIFSTVCLYFIGGLILSMLAMFQLSKFAIPSKSNLMPLLINGAFINGISYIFWMKALSYVRASKLAVMIFLTPVLSSILIVVIFKEPFLFAYAIGLILVVISGILSRAK